MQLLNALSQGHRSEGRPERGENSGSGAIRAKPSLQRFGKVGPPIRRPVDATGKSQRGGSEGADQESLAGPDGGSGRIGRLGELDQSIQRNLRRRAAVMVWKKCPGRVKPIL